MESNRDSMSGDWRDRALCSIEPVDPEIFFPENLPSGETPASVAEICGRCAVQLACFEYAKQHRIKFGFWGGVNVATRKVHRSSAWRQQRKDDIAS